MNGETDSKQQLTVLTALSMKPTIEGGFKETDHSLNR